MEGEALIWFQWMHQNGSLHSWPAFLRAFELRFSPSQFDDPKGALFKLCQTSTMEDYQTAFETLANRIVGLPPQFYLSCFISGLRPHIRREVQAFQPIPLSHAISLAKLQEDQSNDKPSSSINHRHDNQTNPSTFLRPHSPLNRPILTPPQTPLKLQTLLNHPTPPDNHKS
jgi:hypothetical protein